RRKGVVPFPHDRATAARRGPRPGDLRITLLGDAAGATRALVEGGPLVPPFRLDPHIGAGVARLVEQMRRECPGLARAAEMARDIDWDRLMGPTSSGSETETEGEGA